MAISFKKFTDLPSIYKAGSMFIVLCILSALVAWYSNPTTLPKGTFTEAAPIAKVATVPKVSVKTTSVKVIPKSIAVKKIPKIPDTIKDNPDVEIADTADLPASENGVQTITTFDTKTGDIRTLALIKDSPLFAFENKLRLGVGYGVSTKGTTAKIFAEWGFLRVASMHASVQAELNTTATQAPEAKALGVIYYEPRK